MWCRRCSQDVPAIATTDGSSDVACGRCGTLLKATVDSVANLEANVVEVGASSDRAAPVAVNVSPIPAPTTTVESQNGPVPTASTPFRSSTLLGIDDWDLQADLERADSLLRQHSAMLAVDELTSRYRVDLPHPSATTSTRDDLTGTRPTNSNQGVGKDHPALPLPATQLTWHVWLLVCGGMMSLVFGMVLCGWSLGTSRDDLWRIGLPALLAGQAILLLGFVFQLDSLWRNYRQAGESIKQLGDHLSQLKANAEPAPRPVNRVPQSVIN